MTKVYLRNKKQVNNSKEGHNSFNSLSDDDELILLIDNYNKLENKNKKLIEYAENSTMLLNRSHDQIKQQTDYIDKLENKFKIKSGNLSDNKENLKDKINNINYLENHIKRQDNNYLKHLDLYNN